MKTVKKLYMLPTLLILASCGKEFLDIKREAHQVVPSTIEDYQAILNNNAIMNITSYGLASLGSDEYYCSPEVLDALSASNQWQRNGYIWADDVYEGREVNDWNNAYQRILYANLALGVAERPVPEQDEAYNQVVGQALFHRAWNYYQLMQTFCKPYNQTTAAEESGLPLRLEYDVTVQPERASLAQTYEQIVQDLTGALNLLSDRQLVKFQPTRSAANALLARLFLLSEDYALARQHAEAALAVHGELLDFNEIDTTEHFSFTSSAYGEGNPEVIFYCHNTSVTILVESRLQVDTTLLSLYYDGDLRKPIYYRENAGGRINFKGSYRGNVNYFTGLAVDELYLIVAECFAREGDLNGAADALNTLLRHRYTSSAFKPIVFQDQDTALSIILTERRKELYMRGTRWEDIRRWNKEPQFAITLVRKVNDDVYTLEPGATKWVWPLPENEVVLNEWVQNER